MKRLLPLLLSLLAACASVPPAPVHVVVVATTDVHGWFNGHTEVPKGGGEPVRYGGLAAFASYVDALRAENANRVLVVDSGDMFQGTLESNLFEGEAVVRGYNEIGYTAAAIGNHEFDFGPLGPDAIAKSPSDDPLGALKRNASLAKFPFLSANMTEKATGRTPSWAKPYAIVEVGGARVGIIGLSTPDTPNVTNPLNVVALDFGDPVATTIRYAKELRAQGVDAVIVIAHIGGRCTNIEEPHSLESCDRQQEAMHLLESLPPGTIDAFFGGHTHAQMRQFVNGTPAVQALAFSREFSTVDLFIDHKAKKVLADKTALRPHTMICAAVYSGTQTCDPRNPPANAKLEPRQFGGRTMSEDAKLTSLFTPYMQKVDAKRNEKLGVQATATFTRAYMNESQLGDLIADSLRSAFAGDAAIVNSGGIRSDLRAGDLVYSDIFEVSPFDNYPSVVMLTGAQLTEILRLTTTGERGIMQASGIRYTYDNAKDADKKPSDRSRLVSVTLANGEPLDPARLYKVVMPDFIAIGGDGTMPVMKDVPADRIKTFLEKPIREVMIEELKKLPQPIGPKLDGRVTVLNANANAISK
ncbi:MAG TPA: 5'-nucleotidase C-terminal domain-containing protein [Thermoanaerobaculia bacterium]|nr:5'-nucleotidase C-terminal domain-containing protein [Thermoanaerobaculia bacterium]